MSRLFQPAASGRAKHRSCARPIQRGELRFGGRLPNPFADGEEPLLQALGALPRGAG